MPKKRTKNVRMRTRRPSKKLQDHFGLTPEIKKVWNPKQSVRANYARIGIKTAFGIPKNFEQIESKISLNTNQFQIN
jgi:hypothetical protein